MAKPPISRRQILFKLGGLGAYVVAGPTSIANAGPFFAPTASSYLSDLVTALRSAKPQNALRIAGDALADGVGVRALMAAVLEIGVTDIRPRPHGILHTVMMVHASMELADNAGDEEAKLLALWNLHDLKISQQRDRDEFDDWKMKSAPEGPDTEISKVAAKELHQQFSKAMADWDSKGADSALIALFPTLSHASFFHLIWPFAVRCNSFLGHKAIYAANLCRATKRLALSQSAARSLVQTLLVGRETTIWDGNANIASGLAGTPFTKVAATHRNARALYRQMRNADSTACLSVALTALQNNHHPDDIWNALRLIASEVFHNRSGTRSKDGRNALLPVHALTVVNALGYIARTTTDGRLRWRCLLEAVARIPNMREWLQSSTNLPTVTPSLEQLAVGPDVKMASLTAAIASGSPPVVCGYLMNNQTSVAKFGSHLRTSLLRTAQEHHQHKYAAAVLEEAQLAPPELRAMILAPSVSYLVHPDDATTQLHQQSLAVLRG